jgi:hypothetical protein
MQISLFLSAKFILDPSELVSEMINFQTLRAIWNKFENKFMYVTIIHHIPTLRLFETHAR